MSFIRCPDDRLDHHYCYFQYYY